MDELFFELGVVKLTSEVAGGGDQSMDWTYGGRNEGRAILEIR